MLKLTRLNNHTVVINPDHISWVDATPDTLLFLVGGEKIPIRESIDELIAHVIAYRRAIRFPENIGDYFTADGDPPRIGADRRTRPVSSLPPKGGR